ncbi:mechanosensitive ion channel family protein [Pseudofrancisella aestuarii]|uniref:Mechanosensitive ion channel family protein n=1 Tax=Pseudofrancisella aestuarii TaxID=2670347 RepID=A0ABV9TEA1_9GAMM|nr:mechanosensitive ion channel domain-containing protein [Pseudofrancisella aestuarii]
MDLQYTLLNFFKENFNLNHTLSIILVEIFLISCLLGIGLIAYWVLKFINYIYTKKFLDRFIRQASIDGSFEKSLVGTLLKIIPGIIVFIGSKVVIFNQVSWTREVSQIVKSLALLYILYMSLKTVFIILDIFCEWLRKKNHTRYYLIKSFIQALKLIIVFLGVILAVSIIIEKSPLILLTGLGALSAVLLLIFKDSIVGFVANIQVSTYDTVRVGDWITIPSHGADGTVLDIAINTVKIQNFDKTIVSIPTAALISGGVKNWRGMQESGGRRIKRALKIDINTIRFCDDKLIDNLKHIDLLKNYVNNKENCKNITNATLFRYYITEYLKALPTIEHSNFLMLVRHLDPSEVGLPIEIYAFTNTTAWAEYESIQADIFDHLLAMINLFDLKIFQLDDYRKWKINSDN